MTQASSNTPSVPTDYPAFLTDLKQRIHEAQMRAALSVNRELVHLYWQMGRDVSQKQQQESWGGSIIERLAQDLQSAFPGVHGFSARNLWRMRAFYQAYPADEPSSDNQPSSETPILPPLVAEIPWAHNIVLLEKVKDPAERLWYIQQTIEHGWSRSVLVHHIESRLFQRQSKAQTNFERTPPTPQSDLAQNLLKDPYTFDFLTQGQDAHERSMERGLLTHIQKFLLELGVGFAFVGSQYHLDVGDQDFYMDLLFYHLKLRCFVVIELKATNFQPEFAGKMQFYLSAVDDLLRHEGDAPTIGLILCQTKNRVIAEYALRDSTRPIGISTYQLSESLPEGFRGSLPTIEELEDELAQEAGERDEEHR